MTGSVPSVVGVAGGGRMGAGIAHAFALAGAVVTVLERDDTAAAATGDSLRRSIQASVSRGSTAEPADELERRLLVTCDPGDLGGSELVVEAVPEHLETKVDLLRRLEKVLSVDAWLTSNTSSLSIDAIAARLSRPERFCGLHFFNPVPASVLVEIVWGSATDDRLVEAARAWVETLGKTPIVVADAPGFASSRLGVVIALEAIRMLQEGVASASDIDTAMVLGYRFPVGPLRLTDIVGLDVRLGIAEYLEGELGERFAVPDLLREKVAEGKLGRKSGEGFFVWND